HVACQNELAAGAADAACDLRDGDESTRAEPSEQQSQGRFAGQRPRGLSILRDRRDIDVRDEIVGISALEYEHLNGRVGLRLLDQGDEVTHQHPRSSSNYARKDLNDARNSATKAWGCSHAAKCPPLGSLL